MVGMEKCIIGNSCRVYLFFILNIYQGVYFLILITRYTINDANHTSLD